MWKLLPYRLAKKSITPIHAANYAFQGGVAQTPNQSATGGGNVPRHQIISRFRPVIMGRSIVTMGIQGNFPANPFGLTPLANSPEIQAGYNTTTPGNGV